MLENELLMSENEELTENMSDNSPSLTGSLLKNQSIMSGRNSALLNSSAHLIGLSEGTGNQDNTDRN